jgi:MerR family transcriptional regulator, mercuric resistance operon regulatory protein
MHSRVDTESVMATNLKSGDVARLAGLSADTLRHYEKRGLLPKALRTEGGYRLYPPETLDRLRTIQSALRVGFKLSELADFLKERSAGGAPCKRVAEVASHKLEALDGQIADLIALRGFPFRYRNGAAATPQIPSTWQTSRTARLPRSPS